MGEEASLFFRLKSHDDVPRHRLDAWLQQERSKNDWVTGGREGRDSSRPTQTHCYFPLLSAETTRENRHSTQLM
jgi:hypothetical protein